MSQDRLQSWPIWKQFQKDSADVAGLAKLGYAQTKWTEDGNLAWNKEGSWVVIDPKTGKETQVSSEPASASAKTKNNPNAGRARPGRGGQFTESFSQDKLVRVFYKDSNVWGQLKGATEFPITTDGNATLRVKYGTGSWVYGEELEQTEALGVNPEGTFAWYYRFDEKNVIDNYVIFKQNTPHPVFEPQAYPKPGDQNPVVDLFLYDIKLKKSTAVKVRPAAFDDGIGHYIYDIQWSPCSNELFFRRTDRRQKVMELCAVDPSTGATRTIVHEEWPKTWVENKLNVYFFDYMPGEEAKQWSGKAIWESSKNGFINLYLLDLKSGQMLPITQNNFDSTSIVRIDAAQKKIFYMGRGFDNPYNDQLYVVGFDGRGNHAVTDPKFDHRVNISPDGKFFVDTMQTCQDAPRSQLLDMNGKVIKTLVESDMTSFLAAGYSLPERIVFTSADGKTKIHGVLHKPRNFDPAKKYPLIVDVYGGPLDAHNSGFSENFQAYDQETGLGVLKASFDNRGTGGRGKVFSDPLYENMGIVEMDDQTEGVKAIIAKGFVDPQKIGMTGTSYGGYSTIMCLLRHPEIFKAGVACSAPTDWRNYDTIYTERYMGLAGDDKKGYDAGSAMTYAKNLSGALLLYYGSSDENVHPCNSLQLIQKLSRARKWFEVQVGTDQGHSGLDWGRTMEFFFERLNINRG